MAQVHMLTVNMAGNKGEVYPQHWICQTREVALEVLAKWVDEQDSGLLTEEEYAESQGLSATERIDAYFGVSEDTYDIGEMEVLRGLPV